MPWKRWSTLAAALVLAGALCGEAAAQRWDRDDRGRDNWDRDGRGRDDRGRDDRGRAEWVLLGERAVSFKGDRDAIVINHPEDWYRNRAFRRLHLVAERSDIFLKGVRLVYMNGYSEDFPIERMIQDGQDQPIDLRGDRKYLQRIEMLYRSRPSFEGRAVMKVYGEPSRFAAGPGPGPLPPVGPGPGAGVPDRDDPEWVTLGCEGVALFGMDRASIHVGRQEGRFKALRLQVRGADIHMRDLTVIYANGAPDSLPVRAVIAEGQRTRPLDLRGRERSIRSIEMTFATIPTFKGKATVCVEGLQ